MAVITLSWPPRELHPNARPHYHAKAKAAKAYREAAYWATIDTGERWLAPWRDTLIMFFPPDNRHRDLDGMLSSVKAGIDGMCDALNMNDKVISRITIERREPVKGGRVVVTLV